MEYRKEALNIQKEILFLIEKENFEEINDVLNKRKHLYIEFLESDSIELKDLINSKEYIYYEKQINDLFNKKKLEIINELEKLRVSKKATREYRNNIVNRDMFFNKKI